MCHPDENHPINLTLVSRHAMLRLKDAASALVANTRSGNTEGYLSVRSSDVEELLSELKQVASDSIMAGSSDPTPHGKTKN